MGSRRSDPRSARALLRSRHPGGLVSEYHHLLQDGALVRPGEEVERGEVIGFSGTSGKAEGAHLHFVVLKGDRSVPVRFAEAPETPRGTLCRSENVPDSVAARYRDLRTAERACEFLLSERMIAPAVLLARLVLGAEPSEERSQARRSRAELALLAAEERLRGAIRGSEESPAEKPASRAHGLGLPVRAQGAHGSGGRERS